MSIWQKTAVVTASLSMAIASLGAIATPSKAQVGYESTCREVATQRTNLNVRATPGGRIVDTLPPGTTVVITSEIGNWVPITEPTDGYVYSRYLEYCGDAPGQTSVNRPSMNQPIAANPGTNQSFVNNAMCRQISRRRVAEIRENPTQGSPVMNTLRAGQQIIIQNPGANGWVPVEAPVDGYVEARYLTTCN